jgi:hypothetical protein
VCRIDRSCRPRALVAATVWRNVNRVALPKAAKLFSVANMTLAPALQNFYSTPAGMTAPGKHAAALVEVPTDLGALRETIQGIMIHEHWAPAYRIRLSEARKQQSHLRSTAQILDATFAKNPAPLTTVRPLYEKTVGVCRHFTLLTVAVLRQHGIPARSRCGFGSYFTLDTFEDHWVTEYWDDTRWKLMDSQIDPSQRAILHLTMDLHDVPRDRFIIAGDAWQRCRSGRSDPKDFGIFAMRGLWFIAGNVVRDAAALLNMEMLPWDMWGGMIEPEAAPTEEQLAFIDRLAELTLDVDNRFDELQTLDQDERLKVPATVHNAVLNRQDDVIL